MNDPVDRNAGQPAPPADFEPLPILNSFSSMLGQVYIRRQTQGCSVGLYVSQQHLNEGGVCHGGVIATLADYQTLAVREQIGGDRFPLTISLHVDYLSAARLGDWLQSCMVIEKRSARMAFSNAQIVAGDNLVARSTAIYRLPKV